MITLEKPLVTSKKQYSFSNIEEKIKRANILIYQESKECLKKQNDGLQYAAQFRAK